MTTPLAILVGQLTYFTKGMTLREAEQERRRLARQYHPDLDPQHAAIMRQINEEFQALKTYLTTPQPIPFQVNTSDPTTFWAAVVGSAKGNAAAMPQQPTQATARAAQAAAPAPTYTAPPPTQTYTAPPPPPQPAPAPASPTPQPTRTRRSGPRTHRANTVQAEHRDYELALQEPPNKDGLRVYDRVAIIWQDHSRLGDLVVVNDIRVGDYRLQIRVNGAVREEFPLTRAWKLERQVAITRAKSQYL